MESLGVFFYRLNLWLATGPIHAYVAVLAIAVVVLAVGAFAVYRLSGWAYKELPKSRTEEVRKIYADALNDPAVKTVIADALKRARRAAIKDAGGIRQFKRRQRDAHTYMTPDEIVRNFGSGEA